MGIRLGLKNHSGVPPDRAPPAPADATLLGPYPLGNVLVLASLPFVSDHSPPLISFAVEVGGILTVDSG
jgi:hypothetical protein